MRKSRFTESQIVDILKQGEAGVPIAEVLLQHNISKATYFQWRAKHAGGVSRRVEAAEGARGRERQAQTDVRRSRAGERGDQGRLEPKAVTPSWCAPHFDCSPWGRKMRREAPCGRLGAAPYSDNTPVGIRAHGLRATARLPALIHALLGYELFVVRAR